MRARKPVTLSHRLLVALGVVSFLFWGLITALTTWDNIAKIRELYDVHLSLTAKAFLHLMDPDQGIQHTLPPTLSPQDIERLFDSWPDSPESPPGEEQAVAPPATPAISTLPLKRPPTDIRKMRYSSSLSYQLWRSDGSLLFRSDNAPLTPSTGQPGFSDTTDQQGESWRHFNVRDKHHGVRVIVSEPHAYRNQLERNMIMTAAAPMGLGLPLLVLLLWLSIRRGLSPLSSLSLEIAKRQASNLTLIDEQSVPLEVQPIVSVLNDLLKRMADTLESERRFADDAAHQLRTPLAAIQTQLYIVRNTRADAAHQLALDQLQQSIERGIRLVNQLLTLVRLDPGQALPDFELLKIGEIAETTCAELAPLSLQKDQTLELRITPGLPLLTGNADMLSMLISNLVDNAIHYTGDGGHIEITLQASPDGMQLLVSDDGPGIAPDQRDRVFERFYRIAPQHQPGTGLGLAICRRVAELHHATIALSEGLLGRGLTVSVKFLPLPPP